MSRISFEWDSEKEENRKKHGVSFAEAQYAFADPQRVIARDITHSTRDESMNVKTKYSDESLGEVEVVEDFLPSPEQLAFRDESVKVTISLSRSSVDFFKAMAEKYDTPYQKMIRTLLDSYVEKYKTPSTDLSRSNRR